MTKAFTLTTLTDSSGARLRAQPRAARAVPVFRDGIDVLLDRRRVGYLGTHPAGAVRRRPRAAASAVPKPARPTRSVSDGYLDRLLADAAVLQPLRTRGHLRGRLHAGDRHLRLALHR